MMHSFILASKSPRRQEILKESGIPFTIKTFDTEEIYPKELNPKEVPSYLSKLKAAVFKGTIKDDEVVITADTIVLINNEIIGKPKDAEDAKRMLKLLSGNKHEVITGITLLSNTFEHTFHEVTEVFFGPLSDQQIDHYIANYKPFDKAGSYGIQEYIGYIGIQRINGSYLNVVGLPMQKLLQEMSLLKLL